RDLRAQCPRRLLPCAGGGAPPDRGQAPRLDHQHLLADGPRRRRAPHRLLRVEARDGRVHQGHGHRAGAPQHPPQKPGADLSRDADDAALLREQGVPRRGAWQDQARPPRPARGTDRRNHLPRLRRVIPHDRLRACPRRRLDRGVTPAPSVTPKASIMKPLVLFLAAALLPLPAAAQTQSPDRLQKILTAGVLRVGTSMDTPVFSMRDPATGKLEGFDMDALATLGPALGVKIEYVKMTFGTMLVDLAADKFDVAMSGMGRTLERARVATFSKPYLRYGKLVLIRSADAGRFKSLA